jgi:hypothetical protein
MKSDRHPELSATITEIEGLWTQRVVLGDSESGMAPADGV